MILSTTIDSENHLLPNSKMFQYDVCCKLQLTIIYTNQNTVSTPTPIPTADDKFCDFVTSGKRHEMLYSSFMPVCSKVKTITPRCCGRPDALLHQVVHGTEG